MANRRFQQFFNTLHNQPVLLDCNFLVDAGNVNGLGVSGLVGPGIQAIYAHSSASFVGDTHTSTLVDGISSTANLVAGMKVQGSGIAAGTKIASVASSTSIILSAATSTTVGSGTITYQGVGNPNPAAGYAIIQLQDTYNRYYGGFNSIASPLSGSDLTSVTVNLTYVITALGTATTAEWVAKGLPVGITPAIGVAFVASATGTIGGSATVKVPAAAGSNIAAIEVLGNPNKSIVSHAANVPGISSGAYLMVRFMGAAFAGTALGTHTHDFTVIGGQASSTTNNIANYAGPIIGKEQATNATYLGSASATNGGVVAVSAGTPAGSVSLVAANPVDGSQVFLAMYLSNSRILAKGE